MMDSKTRSEALEAAKLLSNDFLWKTLQELEDWYVELWKGIPDADMREKVWFQMNGLKTFTKQLNEKLTKAQVLSKGKDEEIEAAVRTARRK